MMLNLWKSCKGFEQD